MNIEAVNLKKIAKGELISSLLNKNLTAPSPRELKELLKKFERAIDIGDFSTARNTITILIWFQGDATFESIKRKGFFRYSKYTNKKCIVAGLALEVIDICRTLGCLSQPNERYLNSIVNYATVLDSYNAFDKFILQRIKAFEKKYPGKSLVKTLLSYTDFLFLSNHYPKTIDDLSDLNCRSKEEICSAVSYLIYFFTERVRNEKVNIQLVSEPFIQSSELAQLIVPTCYLLDFREFEIFIDHFDYQCVLENDRLLIRPPSENFEKAIRLGYIRTELQRMNDLIDSHDVAVSLEDLVDEINKQDRITFFKLTEANNYPRYRVEIPEPIYDLLIEKFMKPDALFKEEISYLSLVFKEQLLDPDDLQKIKIKDDLTLFEFLKLRRVFVLFYLLFAKAIHKKEKVETDLLLRSLIPIFHFPKFYEFVEKLFPTNKIDSFLDILCWEPGHEKVFDLQYHPILFLDEHFLVPLSILANSNSIRNLYASEYKQSNLNLLSDGGSDPLVVKLQNSFKEASIECYVETSIGSTDVDLFAVFENTLFVFECKHSLHPVSPFDLRTTYDYIKKAEKQLDIIVDAFNKGTLLNILEKKHQITFKGVKQIRGCIVLSNRLFNGNVFRYPIRNVNEIDNMLNRGTMRTEMGTFLLWKEDKLTLDFLLDYFGLDNLLIRLLYDSLSKQTQLYEFAKPKIEFNTYYLDSQVALPKLKEFTDGLKKISE